MPATTTVRTLLQQAQQPSGTYPSSGHDLIVDGVVTANADGSYAIATDPKTGLPFEFAFLNFPMTDADALNTANHLLIYVGWLFPGAPDYDYSLTPAYSWVGGNFKKDGVTPAAPSTDPQIPTKAITNNVGQQVQSAPTKMIVRVDPQGLSINHGIHSAFGDG